MREQREASGGRPPLALIFQRPEFLRACLSYCRFLRGCRRQSCCCQCLVVGKVVVVPIALSATVDVDGGESVRNLSALWI